jgi:hypothetical protein
MLSVLNADKNVKFHLSLTPADLYTVENVSLNEDPQEEIDTNSHRIYYSITIFFNIFFIVKIFIGLQKMIFTRQP